MSRISYKKIFLWLLLFIFTCHKDDPPPPDTSLAVNLTASSSEIGTGEPLTVFIEVKNADLLFALSFELIYSSDLFDTDITAITAGNLFANPFLVSESNFLSDGEFPVALGNLGTIQGSASGTVCSIILTSNSIGSDLLYISSLHMIKEDGSFIDGFDMLSVEPLEVVVY